MKLNREYFRREVVNYNKSTSVDARSMVGGELRLTVLN